MPAPPEQKWTKEYIPQRGNAWQRHGGAGRFYVLPGSSATVYRAVQGTCAVGVEMGCLAPARFTQTQRPTPPPYYLREEKGVSVTSSVAAAPPLPCNCQSGRLKTVPSRARRSPCRTTPRKRIRSLSRSVQVLDRAREPCGGEYSCSGRRC